MVRAEKDLRVILLFWMKWSSLGGVFMNTLTPAPSAVPAEYLCVAYSIDGGPTGRCPWLWFAVRDYLALQDRTAPADAGVEY